MSLRFKFNLLLIFTLAGCAINEPNPEDAIDVSINQASLPAESFNIEHRKAMAQKFNRQQEYQASLTQWQILNTIEPENPEFKNQIRVLEVLIKRRIKRYLTSGKQALDADNLSEAEDNLLRALALDPKNFDALKMMREIESRRVLKVQQVHTQKLIKKQVAKHEAEISRLEGKITNNKSIVEASNEINFSESGVQEVFYLEMGREFFNHGDWNGAIREIDKYLSSNKSTPEIRTMLSISHAKISATFEQRGYWDSSIQHLNEAIEFSDSENIRQRLLAKRDELKLNAAENYYIEGVKVYRDNIDTAITFWKLALQLNPKHEKAESRMKKAELIKQNRKKPSP